MNITEKTRADRPAGNQGHGGESASLEDVESALRLIPSHGWTAGWIGRRRRAELVLIAMADLPSSRLGELSAGDIAIVDEAAFITTADGTVAVEKADETLLCGPCALARWLHALDLMVIYPERVVAATIARAAPLHAGSPHLCDHPVPIAETTQRLPLFPVNAASAGRPIVLAYDGQQLAPQHGWAGDQPSPERSGIPQQMRGR